MRLLFLNIVGNPEFLPSPPLTSQRSVWSFPSFVDRTIEKLERTHLRRKKDVK